MSSSIKVDYKCERHNVHSRVWTDWHFEPLY